MASGRGAVAYGGCMALVVLAGCGEHRTASSSSAPAPRPEAILPGGPTPTPPAAATFAVPSPAEPEGFPEAELAANLCGDRSPCRIVKSESAGMDRQGAALNVVEVALHDRSGDWKEPDLERCAPYEEWLVAQRGSVVVEVQKLLSLCNDGYGANGGGSDLVTVTPGQVAHVQSGGSALRWTTTTIAKLAPLRVEQEGFEEFRIDSGSDDGWTWNWGNGAGEVTWTLPPCSPDGSAWNEMVVGEPKRFKSVVIPKVILPSDFARSGWQHTGLGACGARVASDGSTGFVVHGSPGAARDARMTVLAADDRVLFVEVADDQFVAGAARWIFDDHLEIWLGDGTAECTGPGAVMADDGEVIVGFGKSRAAIGVERVAGGAGEDEWVRFKLTLPDASERVTVVYSDSDDGLTQERLIATSTFAFKHGETIGAVRPISSAKCIAVAGDLEMQYARHFARDVPALQGGPTEEGGR